MHFIMSWDVEGDDKAFVRVSGLISDIVKKHSVMTTEPVSKFLIVKIESEAYWNIILKSITGICEMYKGKVNFIMSPPIPSGSYQGRLKDWTRVNEATK